LLAFALLIVREEGERRVDQKLVLAALDGVAGLFV
jgi:hypothetical protein